LGAISRVCKLQLDNWRAQRNLECMQKIGGSVCDRLGTVLVTSQGWEAVGREGRKLRNRKWICILCAHRKSAISEVQLDLSLLLFE
jgi:hypothetical protein